VQDGRRLRVDVPGREWRRSQLLRHGDGHLLRECDDVSFDAHGRQRSDSAVLSKLVDLMRGRRTVALTGAGVSTESGIPDYRGQGRAPRAPIHGPEFVRHQRVRRRYWARAMVGWERFRDAAPNTGHLALARLEGAGMLLGVVTQNVDGLHRAAGSVRVVELHGALDEVECLACGALERRDALQRRLVEENPGLDARALAAQAAAAPDGDAELEGEAMEHFVVPACLRCEGMLKPRVVFFGDNVPRPRVDEAFALVERAEVLLVVGTSLAVYSGYRFLLRAAERGIAIAIVSVGPVRGEEKAQLRIDGRAGPTLSALAEALDQPAMRGVEPSA
jgi:NAD-dependent SIR2 family protein deacetylase